MKYIYFIVLFIFEICEGNTVKLNISLPLSDTDEYIKTRKLSIEKLSRHFEDYLNLDLSKNPNLNQNIIVIDRTSYNTQYIQFFVESELKPICSKNNIYLNQIYNTVTKSII